LAARRSEDRLMMVVPTVMTGRKMSWRKFDQVSRLGLKERASIRRIT
jgi:hypothetical protein